MVDDQNPYSCSGIPPLFFSLTTRFQLRGAFAYPNQITCRVCFASRCLAKETIHMEFECHHGVAPNPMRLARAIQQSQIHTGQAFSLLSRAWMRDQDQRMQIRVKSGLSKSRPSLTSQMDGPLYLDEIVRRSALFDLDFTIPHLGTPESTSKSTLGYLPMISDFSFGGCLLSLLSPSGEPDRKSMNVRNLSSLCLPCQNMVRA